MKENLEKEIWELTKLVFNVNDPILRNFALENLESGEDQFILLNKYDLYDLID